jgi:glycosyltransferase involved in cell wall biosynthesis
MAARSPAISIIVPIYDVEQYLKRCLDSLISQTLKEIEIICIDDGSPDKSGEIIDSYAKKDKRVKVIHQPNRGAAVARNAGLKISTGEYIGFCDPDDFVDADYFQHLYEAGKRSGADIVKGKTIRKFADGSIQGFGPDIGLMKENRAWFLYSFWTAIYNHEFLRKNKIDFPAGVITGQDVVFLTKAVCLANKLELVDNDSYYNYFKRDGSLDSQYLDDEKITSKIDGSRKIIDFINDIKLDKTTYSIIFNARFNYLIYDVIHRNHRIKNKIKIISEALRIYKTCKYPELYDGKDKDLLENEREAELLIMAMQQSAEQKEIAPKVYYKLFGLVPLIKIRNKRKKSIYRLFNFIPLLVVRNKPAGIIYRLFGVIPLIVKQ